MLSGEFESVPLSSIWWKREDRTRREITEEDIVEKMDSIRECGLIHPLVITREFQGIAGETRFMALHRLGWTSVPVQWTDSLDPRELLAIELEENIKRKDLSWEDKCRAYSRFHDLQLEMHGEAWTLAQSAEAINTSVTSISDAIAVARALQEGNTRVREAGKYSVALGITKRTAERKKADEISALKMDLGNPDDDAEEPTAPREVSPILNADFLTWIETYSGPSFNLIHCDFPYGIGADKFNQGAADAFGGYEDSPETYWKLVDALLENRGKLLGESGHIIFWFSMRYYTETLARLREHFWVDPYPLIWVKSDNKGTLPDPTRGPRRVYEVAFLCSHGDRKIIQSVSNTFSGPTTRVSEHMSEKSQDMLQHFFRMCVDENTRMLDPTCGGGSALRAGRALGAGYVLGLELNADYAELARRAWEK